ncbi:MAG: lysophospholipid acyltransferase family protein [Planctomycetales bacterium]|nr:lysophospholipid acyltransferase family protein [Planctomycetales bacterium]
MESRIVQRTVDYSVYLFVRLLICLVQTMRLETCHRAARSLAWLFTDVLRIRYRVIEENLRHAYPQSKARQRKQLTRAMWEHLFLLATEVAFTRRKIHATSWRKFIRVNDASLMASILLAEDRPKVIVSGHYGNFELGGYALALFGFPTFSIARPLDNPYINDFLNDFRGTTGQFMLPKKGSSQQIEQLLSEGATLALLGDQAAGDRGCWIEFFGRPASAHKAVALFSLGYDAPMLVSYTRRVGGPLEYETGIEGVADPRTSEYKIQNVRGLTQWYSDQLESLVRVAPEQYWWLHRRWKGEPGKRRPRRRAA